MRGRRFGAAVLVLCWPAALVPGLTSCTVVKPMVCSVMFPVQVIGEGLRRDDDEDEKGEEKYQRTPGILAIPTFVIVTPALFVTLSAVGVVGGLTSGIASDLNLLLGNASMEDTGESLRYPFRTNVRKKTD